MEPVPRAAQKAEKDSRTPSPDNGKKAASKKQQQQRRDLQSSRSGLHTAGSTASAQVSYHVMHMRFIQHDAFFRVSTAVRSVLI